MVVLRLHPEKPTISSDFQASALRQRCVSDASAMRRRCTGKPLEKVAECHEVLQHRLLVVGSRIVRILGVVRETNPDW